jgi:glucose-6-phosphate dehydrogenase assembly protein OpcA
VEEAVSAAALIRTPSQRAEWKRIHDGLRSLWRACLPEPNGGDVARSLTINFVGIADAAEAEALREATDRLQRRTPCRAFLLLLDEGAEPGQAELAATTRGQGSMRDIVLEEITIRAPSSAFGQLPGLVRPLLMNDLPNHLFWARPWQHGAADFEALASLCEHVVVDSRRFAAPAKDLAALAARRGKGANITDLAWLRLRPLRRALAEGFERVTWQPGTAVTGHIRHGAQSASASLLLADWLRQRLGANLQLEATATATGTLPEHVLLRTGEFELELLAGPQQIRVHVTTKAHCYLPFLVPTSRGSDADLLAAAIDLG